MNKTNLYFARLSPIGEAEAITLAKDLPSDAVIGDFRQPVELRYERVRYDRAGGGVDQGEVRLRFSGESRVRKGGKPKFFELYVEYPGCLLDQEAEDADDDEDQERDEEERGCKSLEYLTRANAEKGFARELTKITEALKRYARFLGTGTGTWLRVKPNPKFGEPTEILETKELPIVFPNNRPGQSQTGLVKPPSPIPVDNYPTARN